MNQVFTCYSLAGVDSALCVLLRCHRALNVFLLFFAVTGTLPSRWKYT